MPAFVPLVIGLSGHLLRQSVMKAGKKAVVKFGKDVVMKNIHRYTGPAAKRKMYDTFMKTSDKVASSKPVQTLTKNLEKVNPTIRKVAPDGVPVPDPMEQSMYKAVTKVLRGRAIKSASEKVQAIKQRQKDGEITESEANKLLKKLNKEQNFFERTKNNPWM